MWKEKRASKMDPGWQTATRMLVTCEHNGASLLPSTNLHTLVILCQRLCPEDTELSSFVTSTPLPKVFMSLCILCVPRDLA